jgi:CRP/FNR family transcriptional regulator, cyclic AMP receptor protein
MVTMEDLKNIVMLRYLSDEMIASMLPFVAQTQFEEKEIIFNEFEPAEKFYMLKRGKVVLELRVSDKITVSVGSVKPGYAFGWSAMLGDSAYTTDAICAESSEVLEISVKDLKGLLDNNFEMGYILTQRLLVVLKKRLDIRTEQLLRVIKHHPEIQRLFDKSPSGD